MEEPVVVSNKLNHRVLHTALLTLLLFSVLGMGIGIGYFLPKNNAEPVALIQKKDSKITTALSPTRTTLVTATPTITAQPKVCETSKLFENEYFSMCYPSNFAVAKQEVIKDDKTSRSYFRLTLNKDDYSIEVSSYAGVGDTIGNCGVDNPQKIKVSGYDTTRYTVRDERPDGIGKCYDILEYNTFVNSSIYPYKIRYFRISVGDEGYGYTTLDNIGETTNSKLALKELQLVEQTLKIKKS